MELTSREWAGESGVGINFNFCDLRYANSEIYPDPEIAYAGFEILCTAMTAPIV